MKHSWKKKVTYIFIVCSIVCGSLGCADSQFNSDMSLEEHNLTEEMFLESAYPGILVWADINGDGQPEKIQISEEWRAFTINMRIEMEDEIIIEKSFHDQRLPYITAGDLDCDGDAELLITFKGIVEEDMDFILCDYKNGEIKEIEVPEEIKRESIHAYIIGDKSALRVWKKDNKAGCFNYCLKNGTWILESEEELPDGNLSEEIIIQDLCSVKVKDKLSNYWNREIKIDLDNNHKEDIVQVRDVSFSGNHSCTQIRTWIDGKRIADYIYLDNFAFTEILAADLNKNGILELLVRQEVVASNYGANIFSVLYLADNHWNEIEVDIDNIIDIAMMNLNDESFIRIASLTDPQEDIVKIFDVKYTENKIEIIQKEEIRDYYNNVPFYFKKVS